MTKFILWLIVEKAAGAAGVVIGQKDYGATTLLAVVSVYEEPVKVLVFPFGVGVYQPLFLSSFVNFKILLCQKICLTALSW